MSGRFDVQWYTVHSDKQIIVNIYIYTWDVMYKELDMIQTSEAFALQRI